MAETTNLDIVIDANGGSAAAGEVNKVVGSFEALATAHSDIKSKFTERFEHVGVHLFGRELLGVLGIAREARPVLSVMNLAVAEAATTFGVASGGIGLVVFGLTALAAIVFKVVESHKEHEKALESIITKQQGALKTTTELINKINEYAETVGGLPANLNALAEATARLDEVQRRQLTSTEGQQMANLQALIFAKKEKLAADQAEIPSLEQLIEYERHHGEATDGTRLALEHTRAEVVSLTSALTVEGQQYEKLKADIAAQGEGYLDLADKLKQEGTAVEESRKSHDKLADTLAKNAEEARKAGDEFVTFSQKMADKMVDIDDQAGTSKQDNVSRTYQKMRDEVDREYAHEQEVLLNGKMTNIQYYQALGQLHAQHEQLQTAITRTENAKRLDSYRAFFGAARNQEEIMLGAAKDTFNKMASQWSKNVTDMIFDGTKWRENFQDVLKDIVKTFFEAMLQMEIRWAAFQALTGMGFLGGGGGGGVSALAGMPGFKAADGFSGVVTGPTVFLAGEAGAESVEITPVSKSNASSSAVANSSGNVSVGDIHIHGITDPKRIADAVGMEIVKAIRGRGQLNFARAG